VVLGSAPLLIQRGLTESLAGRFEILYLPHWTLDEMRAAFGWGVEEFLFYGGYPGGASLVADPERWRRCGSQSTGQRVQRANIRRDCLRQRSAVLRRDSEKDGGRQVYQVLADVL
jgi:hypothetical protein